MPAMLLFCSSFCLNVLLLAISFINLQFIFTIVYVTSLPYGCISIANYCIRKKRSGMDIVSKG